MGVNEFRDRLMKCETFNAIEDLLREVEQEELAWLIENGAIGMRMDSIRNMVLFCLVWMAPMGCPLPTMRGTTVGLVELRWRLQGGRHFGDPDNEMWLDDNGFIKLRFGPTGLIQYEMKGPPNSHIEQAGQLSQTGLGNIIRQYRNRLARPQLSDEADWYEEERNG